MKKKQLALIGVGRWGKNLARNFYALGALHTLCDTNTALLDQLQTQYPNVKITSNYQAILQNSEVSRVAIAVPAPQHYHLVKQALLAGKDVYVEKPLCLNTEDAEELVALAKERGLILMVGHLLHYHPCIQRLLEFVRNGEIGKIHYIVSNRLNIGGIRTEENALWDLAPHDVSAILSICAGKLLKKVDCFGAAYAVQGIVDTTLTMLEFDEDIRAHIYASWLHPFKEQRLVVIGSSGMLVFDDTKPWNDKLCLYKTSITWEEEASPELTSEHPQPIIVPQKEPLKLECEHFLYCCNHRSTPSSDGSESLNVLKVLQAAQVSLNKKASSLPKPIALTSDLVNVQKAFHHRGQ